MCSVKTTKLAYSPSRGVDMIVSRFEDLLLDKSGRFLVFDSPIDSCRFRLRVFLCVCSNAR